VVIARKAKLTETAWDAVLADPQVGREMRQNGYIEIEAKKLKRITGQEPRILAKMDFSSQRPRSFFENQLNILPIENGKYRIGRFDIFHKVAKYSKDPIFISSPIEFESVAESTSSEGVALRKAEISGMIEQFCGEHIVHTFSGRERSPQFEFRVSNYDHSKSDIKVDGVQIEVDGGFEGKENIYIFEVKNLKTEDFNIRQLYFPFRSYLAKSSKKIRCIYLIHSGDIYTFHEYRFKDQNDLSSIELVQSRSYCLKKPMKSLADVSKGAGKSYWHPDFRLPFPQADQISALIEILKFAGTKGVTDEELEENFEFSSRQLKVKSGYYPNAAQFLGLARIEKGSDLRLVQSQEFFEALERGEFALVELVIDRITQIPGVGRILQEWIRTDRLPSVQEVADYLSVMKDFNELSTSTKLRRARTIKSWCIWIIQHTS
jgi:hypothetical protein